MIDIGNKKVTKRKAIATGQIILDEEIINYIKEKRVPKGDVLNSAKISGLIAIKNTPNLIPFCHPVKITKADINFEIYENKIKAICEVQGIDRTGFEMEALVGVCISLLTIYDMCKIYKKKMKIDEISLIEKKK
ncbi:MAG: cyclic pyranopterin monophosphate synthase MoaC [bacterium]|nr:cyclic pyranopterin monophosphate synthase MoaC [bacterium]MCX7917514.1 cyclic pyranopterin monophosphate synthase MoaC [bacterium]MDW8163600.1 cyclic pyranopterin monophosphate synthase MoaC [Candidatus Omnitrophota bacterium]